ncbi:DUF3182 family protein [Caldimonas tepidiphila]|uniref:DUF3182 family protein n=1 Tax=Caldimonas tepidiphila TaxID=2315841 RepID=UPI000E5BCB88|nr:DUF3182 family protein [Caldimonas tepidiphila]
MGAGPRSDPQRAGAAAHGVLVYHACRASRCPRSHEGVTQRKLAQALAGIAGLDWGGDFDPDTRYPGPVYFVLSDTLCSLDEARRLGIHGEQDLFGGVVPHAFVATKVITHPLLDAASAAPEGWSPGFAERVRDVVLPGCSVFALRDAEAAAARLLAEGGVRLKRASGIGGSGQAVITDPSEIASHLGPDADAELARDGLVLECNLAEVETYSVGQVRVGDLLASYVGTQCSTHNNRGEEVYGGSRLSVARGDFEALLRLDLPPEVRSAVAQARRYHEAALAAFPGMFASRCNYDVVRGVDHAGRPRSGVLEQSWRIGGASGAEVAALAAFRGDPGLDVVRASTTEVYGAAPQVPPDALVYFSGEDERVGPITKYSRLESHGHP